MGRTRRPSAASHLGFLVLLGMVGAALAGATLLGYRNAVETAEGLLRGQAMDMALAVQGAARQGGGSLALLQAFLEQHRGGAVAYAALVRPDGAVLAHTNPRLVGKQLGDARLAAAAGGDRMQTARVALQTGEEVFEATIPLHAPGRAGGVWLLRVALHAAVAERGVRYAEVQGLAAGIVLAALAVLSLRQVRAARRAVALERLAALGEMAAVLAHEIRNPLGAVKGLAQVLAERSAPASPERDLTATMVRETVRLERLVADLLAYARPRPPERRAVDVGVVLREAADLLAGEARAAGVRMVADPPPRPAVAWADPGQLSQLLTNLLLNAIQAMPGGGTVQASVREGRDAIHITVADEGPGIRAQEAARLFEPFVTTRPKGTGLGLAICRRIAEAHGGAIHVEAHGGPGARLRVDLPRAATASDHGVYSARDGRVPARGAGAYP